jgi:hypothetical protein
MSALDDFRAALEAYPIEGPVQARTTEAANHANVVADYRFRVVGFANKAEQTALIAAALNLALEADRARRKEKPPCPCDWCTGCTNPKDCQPYCEWMVDTHALRHAAQSEDVTP